MQSLKNRLTFLYLSSKTRHFARDRGISSHIPQLQQQFTIFCDRNGTNMISLACYSLSFLRSDWNTLTMRSYHSSCKVRTKNDFTSHVLNSLCNYFSHLTWTKLGIVKFTNEASLCLGRLSVSDYHFFEIVSYCFAKIESFHSLGSSSATDILRPLASYFMCISIEKSII